MQTVDISPGSQALDTQRKAQLGYVPSPLVFPDERQEITLVDQAAELIFWRAGNVLVVDRFLIALLWGKVWCGLLFAGLFSAGFYLLLSSGYHRYRAYSFIPRHSVMLLLS